MLCRTFQAGLLDKIQEAFMCIVCQEVVYQPITTPCLHNICKVCTGQGQQKSSLSSNVIYHRSGIFAANRFSVMMLGAKNEKHETFQ